MINSMKQPRTFEVLTPEPVRRRSKPRASSDDEKARIVAATLQPGANVSAVARSEGLDPSQLYGWRRKALASGVEFLPDFGLDAGNRRDHNETTAPEP